MIPAIKKRIISLRRLFDKSMVFSSLNPEYQKILEYDDTV